MIRLNQIGYLYLNTIQKEMRNKTLLFLIIFTVLVIIASYFVVSNFLSGMEVQAGEGLSFLAPQKIFLSILGSWTSFVTIILATGLVKNDEEENVLHQILALPINRAEYLLARILGALSIMTMLYFLSSFLIIVLMGVNKQNFVDLLPLVTSVYSMFFMVLCIVLITLFWSFFLPRIFSFIASFFTLLIVSNANSSFAYGESFFKTLSEGGIWVKFMALVHLIFPPAGAWGTLNSLVLSGEAQMSSLGWASFHGLANCLIFFLILCWLFKRKEL